MPDAVRCTLTPASPYAGDLGDGNVPSKKAAAAAPRPRGWLPTAAACVPLLVCSPCGGDAPDILLRLPTASTTTTTAAQQPLSAPCLQVWLTGLAEGAGLAVGRPISFYEYVGGGKPGTGAGCAAAASVVCEEKDVKQASCWRHELQDQIEPAGGLLSAGFSRLPDVYGRGDTNQ